MHGSKDGSFRATFEDKPLLSDIVFLRAWVAVDLPRFYNPVTNLLAPAPAVVRAPKPGRVRVVLRQHGSACSFDPAYWGHVVHALRASAAHPAKGQACGAIDLDMLHCKPS